MRHQLKNPKLYLMLLGDGLLTAMSLSVAYLLRFEFSLPQEFARQLIRLLPYATSLKLFLFYLFGLYQGMWRYTSLRDFWRVVQASFVSSLLIICAIAYLYHFHGYSRSVFILDFVLTTALVGILRIIIRSALGVRFSGVNLIKAGFPWRLKSSKTPTRIMIIGAGNSGEKILREIEENAHLDYFPVAFLDDDPNKIGRSIRGVPVMGSLDLLPDIAAEYNLDQILIAAPSATGRQMRRMVEYCKLSGLPYKIIPGYGEILEGTVSLKALRDVNFNDLLGRSPVKLQLDEIRNYLADRVIFVTGCGGSIGSELCRQLVGFHPLSLVLLDASEANLYSIQMQLLHQFKFPKITTILGRVQDRPLMAKVFNKYQPSVVFHAAAYKHVPMLEKNPWEAVFNNILGSCVVMDMAAENGAKRFVLVSTDKAVRPTSVMGASKRIAEILLQHHNNISQTKFMAVRFGNVLGSSGSVIPLFRSQIKRGGPVTVTHPDVTRYFMTVQEAAQLIIQAGGMGGGSEIFVLEMGTPVKIAEMARDLIRLSGKEPDRDIEIIYTGLRDGEKLYEELITADENVTATNHEKIMVLKSNGYRPGLMKSEDSWKWLHQELELLYRAARRHDAGAIKEKLSEIVPDYKAHRSDPNL